MTQLYSPWLKRMIKYPFLIFFVMLIRLGLILTTTQKGKASQHLIYLKEES